MMHRRGELRPRHSSWEADEQGVERSAAEPSGAKGGGQGVECAAAKHGPDTEFGEPCHRRWSAYGQAARQRKKEKFTALLHHISIDLLGEAFFERRKDAAPGVDGLIWTDYEQNLERNSEDSGMLASIGERIGHQRRHGERIYPSRMAGSARSRLPP